MSPDNLIKDDQFNFFPGILKNSVNKEDEVVTNDEFSLRLGSVKTSAMESLLGKGSFEIKKKVKNFLNLGRDPPP